MMDANNREQMLSGIDAIDVINKNIGQFVIVRFWAPWCSSCRANEVTVKSVLNQKADICTAFKVNVDREPELTRHLNVQYLPELIIFDREGKAHHLTGEVTEQVMLSHIS
ncbi:thioredoxin family protein [Thiothrix subterranea]|uniref:thioredoxin family protein n=1 Tax=Thiothrix subterranea TaxID=2735563 RepID=UPI00192CA892|nr:thioredoxin family protein [Thiothrix subterranea]QQZ28756.1 thioredoxin family protein [Thiothrix subterranea]